MRGQDLVAEEVRFTGTKAQQLVPRRVPEELTPVVDLESNELPGVLDSVSSRCRSASRWRTDGATTGTRASPAGSSRRNLRVCSSPTTTTPTTKATQLPRE